jgi:uncharacterized LabA/DUF88 family protein
MLVLLLDYRNMAEHEQYVPIVKNWVGHLRSNGLLGEGIHDALVRVYGGWYVGDTVSDERHAAAVSLPEHWPALVSHDGCIVRCQLEFADQLVSLSVRNRLGGISISHTVAVRKRPDYRFKLMPAASNCGVADCGAKGVYRWSKANRGCLHESCPLTFDACFSRLEQKQTDVHLAVDLLEVASCYAPTAVHVCLCSTDVDLAPALLSTGVRISRPSSLTWVRGRSDPYYIDGTLSQLGVFVLNS